MGATVTAANGVQLPIDSLPVTYTYSGSFVSTITTFYAGITYVQTYANNGTEIIGISNWVNQPIVAIYLESESGSNQLIGENGSNLIQENT